MENILSAQVPSTESITRTQAVVNQAMTELNTLHNRSTNHAGSMVGPVTQEQQLLQQAHQAHTLALMSELVLSMRDMMASGSVTPTPQSHQTVISLNITNANPIENQIDATTQATVDSEIDVTAQPDVDVHSESLQQTAQESAQENAQETTQENVQAVVQPAPKPFSFLKAVLVVGAVAGFAGLGSVVHKNHKAKTVQTIEKSKFKMKMPALKLDWE